MVYLMASFCCVPFAYGVQIEGCLVMKVQDPGSEGSAGGGKEAQEPRWGNKWCPQPSHAHNNESQFSKPEKVCKTAEYCFHSGMTGITHTFLNYSSIFLESCSLFSYGLVWVLYWSRCALLAAERRINYFAEQPSGKAESTKPQGFIALDNATVPYVMVHI